MEWTFWILEAKQWVSRYLMWHVLMTNKCLSFCRYNNIQLTVQNIPLHCKIANMKKKIKKSRFLSNDRWAWYGRDVPTNVASNIIPGLQTDLILLTESHCGVFLLHLTVIIDPAGLLRTQTYTCDMIEACSVVKKCDLSLTLWRRSDQRYCSLIRFPSAIWQSVVSGMALRRGTGNRGGNHVNSSPTSTIANYQQGADGVMEWGGVVGQCVHVTNCPLSIYTTGMRGPCYMAGTAKRACSVRPLVTLLATPLTNWPLHHTTDHRLVTWRKCENWRHNCN